MRKAIKKETRDRKVSDIEIESPYKIGQTILAQNKSNLYTEGEWRDAKIIHVRPANKTKKPEELLELYIHYEGFNRRCDE